MEVSLSEVNIIIHISEFTREQTTMTDTYVEHSTVDVKLNRTDRMYHPGETVSGSLLVNAKDGWTHTGMQLGVLGQAKLQLSARSVGLFESMSNLKPLMLLEKSIQV